MVSTISYVNKVFNLPDDSQHFLVRKFLYGASKSAKLSDYRHPVTYSILIKLVNALQFTVPNFFHRLLLHCIFTVAFHGIFRLRELIAKTPSNKPFFIQRQDVSIQGNFKVEIILRLCKLLIPLPSPYLSHPHLRYVQCFPFSHTCQVTNTHQGQFFNSIQVFKYLISLLLITFKRL